MARWVVVVVVGAVGSPLLGRRVVVAACLALACLRVGFVVLGWHCHHVEFVVASLLLLLCLGHRHLLEIRPH